MDEASRHPELIRMDLGKTWMELTGFPMVFAVYAAHRDAPANELKEAHDLLQRQLESYEDSDLKKQSIIDSTSMN